MDEPCPGDHLRRQRADDTRDARPHRRQELQHRSSHRRHPRRAARPALRSGRRRRGLEAPDPAGLCRRHPHGRRRKRARRRSHPVRGAGADVHRLLPADHPRRAVGVLRPRNQPRPDRQSARIRFHRVRPARAAARRSLHLCHDKKVPAALRVRHAARPARHRGARGRRAAQQRKIAGEPVRRGGLFGEIEAEEHDQP
jgi:hypothetical protein